MQTGGFEGGFYSSFFLYGLVHWGQLIIKLRSIDDLDEVIYAQESDESIGSGGGWQHMLSLLEPYRYLAEIKARAGMNGKTIALYSVELQALSKDDFIKECWT